MVSFTNSAKSILITILLLIGYRSVKTQAITKPENGNLFPACSPTSVEFVSQDDIFINIIELVYQDFTDFTQLNTFCDLKKFFSHRNHSFAIYNKCLSECGNGNIAYFRDYTLDTCLRIRFRPKDRTSLSMSLSFLDLADTTKLKSFEAHFYLIERFELQPNKPLISMPQNGTAFKIYFYLSNLVFDYRGRKLDDLACLSAIIDLAEWQNGNQSSSNEHQLQFFAEPPNADYEFSPDNNVGHDICPLVFQNARINTLTFNGLSKSKIVYNYLRFHDLKQISADDDSEVVDSFLDQHLNSHVSYLNFKSAIYLELDKTTVDAYVFKNLNVLNYVGTLSKIETDFFKSLPYLTTVTLHLANMRQFLHDGSSSNNKWMLYLNHEPSFYIYELTIFFYDQSKRYFYPSEDFCLFKYFPASEDASLYAFIMSELIFEPERIKIIATSCTVQYLYSGHRINNGSQPNRLTLYNIYNRTISDQCNFTRMLDECNLMAFQSSHGASYSNIYETTYLLEWFDLIGPIVLFPLVCVFGFASNLIIIIILTRKRFKPDFDSRLFKYLLMNSVFNCVECALNVMQLTGECISPSSVFCSSIRLSDLNVYLRIYVVGYFGEIMKTCSILSSLCFSLERLIDSFEKNNKLLTLFARFNLGSITIAILVFSSLSSTIKIFEFTSQKFVVSTPFKELEWPTKFSLQRDSIFHVIIHFCHYILNDLVFLSLNCFIDFCLLILIKKNLLLKIKLKQKGHYSTSTNTSMIVSLEYAKKLKTERKTYSLLISSLTTYLVCRLPELFLYIFSYFYYIIYTYDDVGFTFSLARCDELSFCYLLANFVDFLYMLSYTTNVFFYCKFNKTFQKNFSEFFRPIFRK